MPTYDYECQNCQHQFELFQSITAAVKRKCPKCGKLKLQRLIGPGAGFLFKGDGFYITDYRSDSYKSGEKQANSDSKKTDSKKAEGKPESKTSGDKSSDSQTKKSTKDS